MKIYTKTGDAGETSLFDSTRVSKADARVDAYGEVDELNACLGVVRSAALDADIEEALAAIQTELFAVGARLADPSSRIAGRVTKAAVTGRRSNGSSRRSTTSKTNVRPCGDSSCRAAPPQARSCTWPAPYAGGPSDASSALGPDAVEPLVTVYLNRLSDLLFVMARAVNHRAGVPETEW